MFVKIFSYAWRWIVRPEAAALEQHYEKKGLQIGLWAVVFFALLYSVAALMLWWRGFVPAFNPIIPVPAKSYYFFQTFITIPWAIVTWLIAGVLVYAWNYLFNRKVRFAEILGPFAYASVVPWFFFTLLPGLVIAPIVGSWGWPPWSDWIETLRQILPAVWMVILFFIAVRKIYDAKWILAVFSSILAAAVFAVMSFVFLR